MALTPSEKRARRDERARQTVNPDTGEFFRNYNALDLWQRNKKAQSIGYTSRAQRRYRHETARANIVTSIMPRAFDNYLGGREATQALANEFERAFGRGSGTPSRIRLREEFFDSDYADDWDWRIWDEEYSAL